MLTNPKKSENGCKCFWKTFFRFSQFKQSAMPNGLRSQLADRFRQEATGERHQTAMRSQWLAELASNFIGT